MRIIKRLYLFILKSFLPLFAMTFFIVLFIILMQFLWKNIDELVGKGLTLSLLGELFFYAGLSTVPMALPLSILLASLMTFGNFGEKFELTAMKASGISLFKAMKPLIVVIVFVAIGAYYFQNTVIPKAQVKMWTLLWSMRMKSPELEIPEGVFYQNIPGYNLFVLHKNRDTGMLYDMMIYDVSHGGDNSTILLADSGRLAFTPDMRYLYLHLYQGEQFENLREQKSIDRNVPFRRETFLEKEVLIPFDANFNRLDEGGIRSQSVGKNTDELRQSIDSIGARLDSVGSLYARDLKSSSFPLLRGQQYNRYGFPDDGMPRSEDTVPAADVKYAAVEIDTLIRKLPYDHQQRIYDQAISISQREVNDYQFKSLVVAEDKKNLRRHEMELLKKFTLSVACLVFFFIGAPLGAIIRKGGLGMPLVISVLLFLVYYIIDNTGSKMARDGHWAIWFGMWLSTFILAPLGVYVTYKAMNDSSVFDADRYKALLNKFIGRKSERKVLYKEVILEETAPQVAIQTLLGLNEMVSRFIDATPKRQSYLEYFRRGYDDTEIRAISATLDSDIELLTNCRNKLAVNKLVDYPVILDTWMYCPANLKWGSKALMLLFPLGVFVYFVGRARQRHLLSDMRHILKVDNTIIELLEKPEG